MGRSYFTPNVLRAIWSRWNRLPAPTSVAAPRSCQEASFRAPLVEGKVGRFTLMPLFRGADYLGMLYTIRLE